MKKVSPDFFLGIDQGTQSSRAIVFDQNGTIISTAQVAVSIRNISPVEVEQDGAEILHSITSCLDEIFQTIQPKRIKAAGLATQRSSVIAWDSHSGKPLGPILSWRDRRGAKFVDTLQAHEQLIQEKTGLRLTAYYGASKIRWLLNNNVAIQNAQKEERLNVGPLASFLVYSLGNEHTYVIDHANALRTQLLNLATLDWDHELFEIFELPQGLMPRAVATDCYYGKLYQTDIPLRSVNGDQTAAMYSLGEMKKSEVLVNLGTGGFVLCPIDTRTIIPAGMLGGLSSSRNNACEHLLEGTINGCGAALNWYREKLGESDQFDVDNSLQKFNGEIIFSNGINGLGSPYWKAMAPEFFDLRKQNIVTDPALSQAVAAIIESIIFLVQVNINQIKKVNAIDSIRLTGGLANSKNVCQLLANLSGLEVMRPDIAEATARGSAWLASGIKTPWPTGPATQIYQPKPEKSLQLRFRKFQIILNGGIHCRQE